jgi:excinuclease ABC subunit A
MQSGNNKQSPQSPQSYTGQALSPVLAAGPLVERQWFDPAVADQVRADDLEIEDVGKQTKMPWESDGRRWHTIDRVGRAGEACKWDGRILGAVVDYVQDREGFAETNWNSRTIVEVTGAKKNAGWFLHALTGEAWMLKLKFRIPRNTFDPLHLQNTLPLKTLNEMVDLPVYGNEPRVTIKNVHGAWQEVQIRAHSFDEIDVPAFWEFVNNAVDAFQNYALSMADSSAEIMPWKKLGERWHMARKGFPMGQPPKWDVQLLHQVVQLLQNVSPTGRFEWTNQVIVHHYLPGKQEPWATLETKRPDYVGVILRVPKQSVALGSILELGSDRAIDGSRAGAWDVVRIQFQTLADLQRGDLQGLLTRVSRELWTT